MNKKKIKTRQSNFQKMVKLTNLPRKRKRKPIQNQNTTKPPTFTPEISNLSTNNKKKKHSDQQSQEMAMLITRTHQRT